MNIEKLNQLVARLRSLKGTEQSKRFNMRTWGISADEAVKLDLLEERPVCNTQACLAGETVLMLKRGRIGRRGGIVGLPKAYQGGFRNEGIGDLAAAELELTWDEKARLFYPHSIIHRHCWPYEFQARYDRARTPNGRLRVAIARVRHFIKTEGRE
jgi:hypothetical protein